MPIALIDHDQIDDRVVDLYLLQRQGDWRRDTAGTLQDASGVLAFPTTSEFERVQGGDPQRNGVACRHPQVLLFACSCDFAVKCRQAALLLGQIALLQQLANDAFNRFWQTPLPFTATGLPGSQVRYKA